MKITTAFLTLSALTENRMVEFHDILVAIIVSGVDIWDRYDLAIGKQACLAFS
jgi:hypothetical protein